MKITDEEEGLLPLLRRDLGLRLRRKQTDEFCEHGSSLGVEVSGPLELGRQRTGEAGPFRQSEAETAGASRVVCL